MRQVITTCLLALGLALAQPADATTVLYLTEAEHLAESTAVAVVTVQAQSVRPAPEYGIPETLSLMSVDRVLWGDAPEQLTIRQFGGELDGQVTYVPGDATFKVGERAVVFLRQHEGSWFLTAMEQSKYRIVPSVDGDVLERTLGEGIVTQGPKGSLLPVKNPPQALGTVEDFATLLQELDVEVE